MTCFAGHLGTQGYDRVREIFAVAVRGKDPGCAAKAGAHVAHRRFRGARAVAAEIIGDRPVLADGIAEATRQDPLVATNVLPETRLTVERADYARGARHPPQAAIRRARRDENLAART